MSIVSMSSLGDVVAANVRGLRARRRWTQALLAERLGWAAGTVSALETGRRAVAVNDLAPLCRALETDLAELVRGADAEDLRDTGLRDLL